MRKLIKIFAGYISTKNGYTKDMEDQIEYALRITIFEAVKIFGVIFVFNLFGHPIEAVTAVITMAIIKPFIGGYHEDSQIKCFAAAVIIVGSAVYLSAHLEIDIISKLILSAISVYCIWNQAPVVNPRMALTRPELIRRNRNVGLFLVIVFILLSIILFKYKSVSDSILWMVVFQTLLMFNKRDLQGN